MSELAYSGCSNKSVLTHDGTSNATQNALSATNSYRLKRIRGDDSTVTQPVVNETDEQSSEQHDRDDRSDEQPSDDPGYVTKDEFTQYREQNERDKAEIRKDVADVHETVEDTDVGSDGSDGTRDAVDTSLVQITQWPKEVAQKQLTVNEAKARQFAPKIPLLGTKVQNGVVITASEVQSFFKSRGYGRQHTETVARIMDCLNDFAMEYGSISMKDGRRRLLISTELANALEQQRKHDWCDTTATATT